MGSIGIWGPWRGRGAPWGFGIRGGLGSVGRRSLGRVGSVGGSSRWGGIRGGSSVEGVGIRGAGVGIRGG